MEFDQLDFYVFCTHLLVSLRRDVPVQENLRDIMSGMLHKLLLYSEYDGAAHVFANPRLSEAHVMLLRRGTPEWDAVERQARARAGLRSSPPQPMPEYRCIPFDRTWEPRFDALSDDSVVRMQQVGDPFVGRAEGAFGELLARLRPAVSSVRDASWPTGGQHLAVVPLGRIEQRRLGSLVLWRNEPRTAAVLSGREGEGLLQFGLGMGRLLLKVFETLYQAREETYLPSYYCPQSRPVALLCVELRHLDVIATALDTRKDIDVRECLRALVNRFFRSAAGEVERFKGRVDQMWSGGLLAVFGEYLDAPDSSDVVACMRAIQSASMIVRTFESESNTWLSQDFHVERYQQSHNRHITTGVAVAASFGDVQLDYLGSLEHRRYMAFGDQVSFVRDLVNLAGRTVLDEGSARLDAPIVASQAIFARVRPACIRAKNAQQPLASVETPQLVRFPGRSDCFPVYGLWPGNIDVTS